MESDKSKAIVDHTRQRRGVGNARYGWLGVSLIGLFCLCVKICLGTSGAGPLNACAAVEEPPPGFEAAENGSVSDAVGDAFSLDTEQELLDLLRNSSFKADESPRWKAVRMRVTGYCACPKCCGKFSDGWTANMHKIRYGDVFIAADKKIPFGTRIIVSGYNRDFPVEVWDRGRLIQGNRLDVFFSNHRTAQKWGVKYLDVLVKVDDEIRYAEKQAGSRWR